MSWLKRVSKSTRTVNPSPPAPASDIPNPSSPVSFSTPYQYPQAQAQKGIQIFHSHSKKLPGLNPSELRLLRQKQQELSSTATSVIASLQPRPFILNALEATLIFAQREAGTAICIDAAGWLLTCSHCIGDTAEEWTAKKRKWLLYYTGLAVQVECRAWDPKRDLALLKIIAIETEISILTPNDSVPTFPFVSLASSAPGQVGNGREPIACIGQPGRDDLESHLTGRMTTEYSLVEVSEGMIRGMVPGADPHDNEAIGALKHDVWTYWGHSGAPLLRRRDGGLLGLHSSWDDKTGMRHGVALVAIEAFLERHLPSRGGRGGGGDGGGDEGLSLLGRMEGRSRGKRNRSPRPKGEHDDSTDSEESSRSLVGKRRAPMAEVVDLT